jgi:DNA-binding NarL/FixJ family response regulator
MGHELIRRASHNPAMRLEIRSDAPPSKSRLSACMPTRILIADDNALVRTAMRQVLENVGPWEVIEAANGKQAVTIALECKPNLVILDLAMPVKDGLTTARELVQLLPEVPILMHTLYWSPRIELEALKAGVRKAVPKSESGVIVNAVKELLGTGAAATAAIATERRAGDLITVENAVSLEVAAATSSEKSVTQTDGGPGAGEAPGDGRQRAS